MRWAVLILLGVFFVSFASSEIPGDCSSSLVAYWQFDNDVADSIGGYDGSWTGTERYDPFAVNNATVFAGAEKITIPNVPASLLTSSFTIEMWIKSENSLGGDLFTKGNYNIGWEFSMPPSGNIEASVGSAILSSTPIFQNTDHHIAFVWDSSNAILKLYVDGLSVNETALLSSGDARGDIFIGDGFTGLIDELAIYEDDLSDADILAQYELGVDGKDYCSGELSDDTQTNFNSGGCTFSWEGRQIGVPFGECTESSTGSAEGEFFCGEFGEGTDEGGGWFTKRADGVGTLGCARGNEDYVSGTGVNPCCPLGQNLYCGEATDVDGALTGGFICKQNLNTCPDFSGSPGDTDAEDACEDANCTYWCDGTCMANTDDLLCSDYCDASSCDADVERLADNLDVVGACDRVITCGPKDTQFTVGCACKWNTTDLTDPSGKCVNDKIASETFFKIIAGTVIKGIFACTEDCTSGNCTEGKQDVNCSSEERIIDSVAHIWLINEVPEDCWDALGCMDGVFPRSCGEPIVKAPGFSMFSFIASVIILMSFYTFRESRKDLNRTRK